MNDICKFARHLKWLEKFSWNGYVKEQLLLFFFVLNLSITSIQSRKEFK
jgi:hypothetical protein